MKVVFWNLMKTDDLKRKGIVDFVRRVALVGYVVFEIRPGDFVEVD